MATRSKKIYDWNMSRGLIDAGFALEAEVALLKEELDEFQFNKPKHKCPLLNRFRKESTTEQKIDALCDLIVVATGAMYKLGYNADKALDETIKEINSRTGSINASTGKFTKFTHKEAKDKWYLADYKKCLLD